MEQVGTVAVTLAMEAWLLADLELFFNSDLVAIFIASMYTPIFNVFAIFLGSPFKPNLRKQKKLRSGVRRSNKRLLKMHGGQRFWMCNDAKVLADGSDGLCFWDDEADLTTYDEIGSEERILLLKGFVISKIRHLFLKLRANQANSSQSNEGTG
ncbi:hypothetical protein Tco_0588407 [Tanacetum coccineum]